MGKLLEIAFLGRKGEGKKMIGSGVKRLKGLGIKGWWDPGEP
jgi:hypothetical protein